MVGETTTPAGWFPDPGGHHEHRYWDGTQWTEHVADAGRQSAEPLGAVPSVPTAAAGPTTPTLPFVPVEFADIAVHLDPVAARDSVVAQFGARGFRVTFQDAWTAIAERGNKGMNVAFGAMAQYYCVGLTVLTGPGGETVVRLLRAPTGFWSGGGLIGKARVSGAFAKITNELIGAFTQQGVLIGVQHG